jgi:NitT/TauT family transport system substrate-binding protein
MARGRGAPWRGALLAALAGLLMACGTPTAAPPAARSSAPSPTVPAPAATAVPSPPAALVSVTYATQRPVSDAPIFIAHAKGYFQQEGLDVEIVNFPGANDMIPALATGQLDTGATSAIASFFNAVAGGVDVKTVAERSSNAPGHGFAAMLVRKDLVDGGRFHDLADLAGKQIGVSPPVGGGPLSVDLLVALDQAGLRWDDVNPKGLGFPDLDAALRNGSLDVVFGVEPWVSQAVSNGYGVRWKGVDEIYPNHMIAGVAYSPVFAAQKPAAARAFMVAYVRAIRDYNDALNKGQGREQLYAILAEYSTIKDRAVLERMTLPSINPDPFVHRTSVSIDQEAYLRLGTVKERVDLERIIDDQYVQYAVERLGPYR